MSFPCKDGSRLCIGCMSCCESDFSMLNDTEDWLGEEEFTLVCHNCGCDITKTKGYKIQDLIVCEACLEDYALDLGVV